MIDKLSYDDVLNISKELNKEAQIVKELATKREINDLLDFVSTVEGYSKFLENTVEINKDADNALSELKTQITKGLS